MAHSSHAAGEYVELISPTEAERADRLFEQWARRSGLSRRDRASGVIREELHATGGAAMCRYRVRRELTGSVEPPSIVYGPVSHDAPSATYGVAVVLMFAAFVTAPVALAIGAIAWIASHVGALDVHLVVDHRTLVMLTLATIAVSYGVGFARLVGGYLHRHDRPPTFFAKQLAVLVGSVPSVGLMAFTLLYARVPLLVGFALCGVYGSSYLVIIRQFVEKPPTREEILAVLRSFLSMSPPRLPPPPRP